MSYLPSGRSTIPEPEYYKGWVIQPYGGGYFVYSRRDTFGPDGDRVSSLQDAYEYIDSKTREER